MKRRAFLTSLLLLSSAAADTKRNDFEASIWREYEEAANAFAEAHNKGVFDYKAWNRLKRAFKKVGGCDDCS